MLVEKNKKIVIPDLFLYFKETGKIKYYRNKYG